MKGIVVQALLFASSVMAGWPEAKGKLIKYSSVPGYFLQDDPNTDPSTFDYVYDCPSELHRLQLALTETE